MRRRVFLFGAILTGVGLPMLAGCKMPGWSKHQAGSTSAASSSAGKASGTSLACGVGGASGLAGVRRSRHGSSPGVPGLTTGAPRREDHRPGPETDAGQGRRRSQGHRTGRVLLQAMSTPTPSRRPDHCRAPAAIGSRPSTGVRPGCACWTWPPTGCG